MATEMCLICDEKLKDGTAITTVKKKGINTFIARSKAKNDDKWKILETLTEVQFHELCRIKYIIKKQQVFWDAKQTGEFVFKSNCFLCGRRWDPIDQPGVIVSSEEKQESLMKNIELRGDEWAEWVRKKIENVSLLEVEARYHKACDNKFKYKPTEKETSEVAPLDPGLVKVFEFMEENSDGHFTLTELVDKMGNSSMTTETLKQKLIDKYGDDLFFVERPAESNVVCFRKTAHKILVDAWHRQQKAATEAEKAKTIRAALEILREDIMNRYYQTSNCPELSDNFENDMPETLAAFVDRLVDGGDSESSDDLNRKREVARSLILSMQPEESDDDQEDDENPQPSTSKKRRLDKSK